jgi:hypothetical protein
MFPKEKAPPVASAVGLPGSWVPGNLCVTCLRGSGVRHTFHLVPTAKRLSTLTLNDGYITLEAEDLRPDQQAITDWLKQHGLPEGW